MSRKKYLGLCLLILPVCIKAAECPQWNHSEAQNRINTLAAEIWRHDMLYHERSAPEINDAEYDALEKQLTRLQTCFPNIPVQRYQPKTHNNSLRHTAFMGSLKKADNEDDVKTFLQKFSSSEIIVQPKIDGIAVELIYQKGMLSKAITRGDGEQGKNITQHVKLMPLIPQQLPQANDLVLHGELFARLDLVDKAVLKRYVSARHLVAGQMNRSKPELTTLAAIDFFPWRWVDAPFISEIDTLKALASFGFKHPRQYTHRVNTLEDISRWRTTYGHKEDEIFLMDGVVIKSAIINDRKNDNRNREYPNWALAWKFSAKTAITTVIDIEFSKGETGKITPVLILSPVTIEGREIQRVSLGSMNNYQSKNVAVGDQVSVMLKGSATPVFGQVIVRDVEQRKSEDLEKE